MRSVIAQVLLLFFASGALVKRSPLQVGLVAITERPHLHNVTAKIAIPPVIMSSHTHKWIPGHVHHHSYIPAHLNHLYLPTHALLLARTVETVFVHPDLYRHHIGGFGIGVNTGGHGAGHGFHVVFNF
ncbi:uncharacterized protein [Tenebrio molitor]|uniref:uncharacterized protein n=1 Tax=Tenebrio molitor TaxID=7067 RepID=UPI0036247C7C